jgi:hypothetical protein
MFHPTFSSLFSDPKNILSTANHEASHRSNSNRPPLPRHSQGQQRENYGNILHFLQFILI